MRVLHLADRLSRRGGADHHLRDVLAAQRTRHRLTLAVGRVTASSPAGVTVQKVRGLGSPVASTAGLSALTGLIDTADVVHCHNVMNPVVLAQVAASGKGVVTVQDHRVFCPGPGKTLPTGEVCGTGFTDAACAVCLTDDVYRERLVALTRARLDALQGMRCIVLSRWMQAQLAAVGVESQVIPPWVDVGPEPLIGEGAVLAGRLVAHKAPLAAVELCEAWGVPLTVCGVGALADQMHGVEHMGWIGRPVLREVLRRARMCLFPSRWQEPFGIVGVEALAMGTPVIAQVTGGMDEWADVGCLPWDDADLSALTPERALELGRAGQAMVRERFSQERLSPRIEAVYGTVG